MSLIKPLSLETLKVFGAERSLRRNDRPNLLSGKFVRLSGAIIIGDNPNPTGNPDAVRHDELATYLRFEERELYAKAFQEHQAQQSESLLEDSRLHDAGTMTLCIDADRYPVSLTIDGQSSAYGWAGEVGRQNTMDVAQVLVGEDVRVLGRVSLY